MMQQGETSLRLLAGRLAAGNRQAHGSELPAIAILLNFGSVSLTRSSCLPLPNAGPPAKAVTTINNPDTSVVFMLCLHFIFIPKRVVLPQNPEAEYDQRGAQPWCRNPRI
jgi:hypothetical protein